MWEKNTGQMHGERLRFHVINNNNNISHPERQERSRQHYWRRERWQWWPRNMHGTMNTKIQWILEQTESKKSTEVP